MPETNRERRQQAYREAIRLKVCSVCLDSRDDLSCSLGGRVCAIEGHLSQLVEALSGIDSSRIDPYEEAVRALVCSDCEQQDEQGQCRLRNKGDCALESFLPFVVDAVEDVNQRLALEGEPRAGEPAQVKGPSS